MGRAPGKIPLAVLQHALAQIVCPNVIELMAWLTILAQISKFALTQDGQRAVVQTELIGHISLHAAASLRLMFIP